MERFVLKDLEKWKNSNKRKPLILAGVRQCGKTWALREFGKKFYKNVASFDFYESPEYHQFFQTTKDPGRIIQNLAMASGQIINPQETLVIFDEIQECGEALGTLKYFCDKAPEYHLACAGSLLGLSLPKPADEFKNPSFPVGKVNFIDMYPMSFSEFLIANGDENLKKYLDGIDRIEPIPDAFYNPLHEKLKMYFITGGMPESVGQWAENRDVSAVQGVLSEILRAYERDFAKHAPVVDYPKINLVWQSLPSQLSRENKKFIYNIAKTGARAREYEDALQWLADANLVYKTFRITAPRLPLMSYRDVSAFKIYAADVGLLRRMSLLSPAAFGEGNRLFTEFKGALTENYILQSLKPQFESIPHYWSTDNPRYEVDFIVEQNNKIYPIEVKSDENIESKSLKKFAEFFPNETGLRVRFSMRNLKKDGDVLNIPLFLVDYASKLLEMI